MIYSTEYNKGTKDIEATVERVGARGDGICTSEGRKIYAPFTLPGEKLRLRITGKQGDGLAAKVEEILTPSDDREVPVCRHFTRCGGCNLQHMKAEPIAVMKRQMLTEALGRKGFDDLEVAATSSTPPGARRRVRLTCRRLKGRTVLGFNERAGKMVVDLAECPVVVPEIAKLLPTLRKICTGLDALGKAADIQVTLCDSGLDILFAPDRAASPGLADREALLDFAEAHDIARISWEDKGFIEPLAARRAARADFGGVTVDLPAGSFLQPSRPGEHRLAELVHQATLKADKIADLYAGCGSLTLPMANDPRRPMVHAVDGAEAQIGALRKAVQGLRVTAEIRDLAKSPLSASELNRFDAVVFDPPRAGAATQSEAIAESQVPIVVAVSCNPSTLARDLRILVDGGYKLGPVTPVDQFTWSSHLEAVAVLHR